MSSNGCRDQLIAVPLQASTQPRFGGFSHADRLRVAYASSTLFPDRDHYTASARLLRLRARSRPRFDHCAAVGSCSRIVLLLSRSARHATVAQEAAESHRRHAVSGISVMLEAVFSWLAMPSKTYRQSPAVPTIHVARRDGAILSVPRRGRGANHSANRPAKNNLTSDPDHPDYDDRSSISRSGGQEYIAIKPGRPG